ncbi:hypothetical protein [Larkinella arboricola]
MKFSLKYRALLLFMLVGSTTVLGQKFTIPVLPDTQEEVGAKPEMFVSQLNWIVKKKDSLNIPIVLHVGDIVNFDTVTHWQTASKIFTILDTARIGYAVTLGNHDTGAVRHNAGSAAPGNVNQNLRKTAKFNTYFPVSRFPMQRGRYEENKSDNAWYTFSAGGKDWLVLALEFCARQGPVDWAQTVLKDHPNHNVIVLTHYHLNPTSEISTRNAGYGDLSPAQIYDQLIRKHPNVLLVLSGHVVYSAWRDDLGEHGNHIYQLLQNYQSQDHGGGYIRLLEIDPQAGTISAKMYSPYYNKTLTDFTNFSFSGVKFVDKK